MRSRGVLYMAASAFGFSVMSLQVKIAAAHLPTGELVLARAVVTLALSYAMVRRLGLSPWGHERARLALRGLLGFGGLACYYGAIALLPLADATTLQNTTPLFTALLAWWLLGERIGWGSAVAIGFGLGGVVLVAHPATGGLDPAGVAIALSGAVISAVAYVTVRRLVRTEHPYVIVFYFPLVATPLALPWAMARWVWPSLNEWLLMVGIGVATQVGQVFLTLGLAELPAGRATAVGYLQICFAMMWELAVFSRWPTWGTVAGAALIIVGTLAATSRARAE